jgi:hypothetical protein
MSLKRFTSVRNLRGLGRPLLKKFFDRFEEELKECKATLPPTSLENDDEYFKQLADVFFAPKELPQTMTAVLDAVVEMANEKGVECLCKAAKEKNLLIDWEKKATDLDIVMQVWLADAALMIEKHNEHRLVGTTKFYYWGTKTPPANRLPFTPPTKEALELARKAVDKWCVENHRGEDTVVITPHELDGEWWFLIQHGGTMSRLAESKGNQKTETLFYRPGKDDVVVYNVERDEIRIHTGSKAEWELYRTEFGQRLRGDPNYFSERKNFKLDPLRDDLGKALDLDGLTDIKSIVLQEVEIFYGGDFADKMVKKSNDMVISAAERSKNGKVVKPFPDGGKLTRAVFEIEFVNAKKPRRVTVRPPDELNVGRHGDVRAVQNWLSKRKFRDFDENGNGA